MEVLPRVRRVDTVRGPRISVAPHPAAADSVVAVQEWVASRALQRPLAADLFCGAGGLSLGLTDAGYDVVVGVDSDTVALETYAGLHPGLTLCRDLNDQDSVAEVAATISKLGVDLIAGGPPCQPFSKAGVSKIRSLVRTGVRPEYDVRRDLWQAFLGGCASGCSPVRSCLRMFPTWPLPPIRSLSAVWSGSLRPTAIRSTRGCCVRVITACLRFASVFCWWHWLMDSDFGGLRLYAIP